MKEKVLIKKICSVHASDLHFATVIFPYITKRIQNNITVRTILERNEEDNIEKIIKNIGLNSEIKNKIRNIDWKESDTNKIRSIFKLLENDITKLNNIDLIILGNNLFIQKVNKAIELWVKNNINVIERNQVELNIINCFSMQENKQIEKIINTHDYILKTTGLEKIMLMQDLLQAN